MASMTTNKRVAVLQARHRAELRAVEAVAAAGRVVDATVRRRVEVLAGLDDRVAQARGDHRVALAVLAELLGRDEVTAEVAEVDVTEVRAARRSVPMSEVMERLAGLLAAPVRLGGGVRGGGGVAGSRSGEMAADGGGGASDRDPGL
jgi:hypothetical protein